MDRLGWAEQSPHYVSFINQSVEAAAKLVVADRLVAPFELSKQSKLIIGQLRHGGLPWFRPKVAHLNTAETAALRDFNPPNVGSGSFTSLWLLRSTVRMSASHPKATESLRSSEMTLSARAQSRCAPARCAGARAARP